MYCKHCGSAVGEKAVVCMNCGVLVGDGDNYCSNCGAHPDPKAVVCVKCGHKLKNFGRGRGRGWGSSEVVNTNIYSFGKAIVTCYSKYATFKGRACRAEYWWWFLYNSLFYILGIVGGYFVLYGPYYTTGLVMYICSNIVVLGNMLPSISATIRRLHDTGHSGGWYFINFIPVAGWIILMVYLCQDSEDETNAYGTNPKRYE